MSERIVPKSDWVCISCGRVLGKVYGGEFYPSVDGSFLHTSGANLSVRCPDCDTIKIFYTADPVVRAVYQLVDAIASVAARSMVNSVGQAIRERKDE